MSKPIQKPRTKINTTIIYDSKNYGKYKILNEEEPRYNHKGYPIRMVKIKFLLTGTEKIIALSNAVHNKPGRDPYFPNVCGVGFIGCLNKKDYSREYSVWNGIIDRCYNKNSPSYSMYGAIGITVCERWFDFSNFVKDIKILPGYNEWIKDHSYQLDKDLLQAGIPKHKRIYSPETCCFVSYTDNINARTIDNKKENHYYGVYKTKRNPNLYNCFCRKNPYSNNKELYGTFDNAEAAAVVYNYFSEYRGMPVNEGLSMSIEEALTHLVGRNKNRIMCEINTSNRTLDPFKEIIYHSNSGDYIIIGESRSYTEKCGKKTKMYFVKFLKTGTIVEARLSEIKGRTVKDPYHPNIFNVACIGKTTIKGNEKEYHIWMNMIESVYNEKKKLALSNCTIDQRWLCFEYFLDDIKYLPGYYEWKNGYGYTFSRNFVNDITIVSNTVFSRDTCRFISIPDAKYIKIKTCSRKEEYAGITKAYSKNGTESWRCSINLKNGERYEAIYDDPTAAATIFDFYFNMNYGRTINNTGMDIYTALSHRQTRIPLKTMCLRVMCKPVNI